MTRPRIDIDAAPALAFGLADEHAPFSGDWHQHARHQLLYAESGSMQLEVAGGRWLLPPRRAAWIRAGVRHRVETRGHLALRAVVLDPSLTAGPAAACLIVDMEPVAREMVRYAMRWGPDRSPEDPVAGPFFAALAALVEDWARTPRPFLLPVPQSEALLAATEYARAHLDEEPDLDEVAARAHVSARTLARRFAAELHLSWRDYLQRARLLRAMERLASPDAQVTAVAFEVGFRSPAAFSRAFKDFTGETPVAYRRRMRG